MFGFTRGRTDAKSKTPTPPQQAKGGAQKSGRPDIKVGERRSGNDRRSEAPSKNDAGGAPSGVDIRSGDDRRVLRYGIAIKTSGSVGKIGDWLEENCDGRTCIVLSDLERQHGIKELKVMFELETDKEKFKGFIKTGV